MSHDRFFTFTGTGIGFGPLTPDRQSFAMADTTVGTDLHLTTHILIDLTAQITFGDVILLHQRGDTGNFFFG